MGKIIIGKQCNKKCTGECEHLNQLSVDILNKKAIQRQVANYCGIPKISFLGFFFFVVSYMGTLESLWKLEVVFPFLPDDTTFHSVIWIVIQIWDSLQTLLPYSIITSLSPSPSFDLPHSPTNLNSKGSPKFFSPTLVMSEPFGSLSVVSRSLSQRGAGALL